MTKITGGKDRKGGGGGTWEKTKKLLAGGKNWKKSTKDQKKKCKVMIVFRFWDIKQASQRNNGGRGSRGIIF